MAADGASAGGGVPHSAEDLEAFLAKVDAATKTVKALAEGTIDPDDVKPISTDGKIELPEALAAEERAARDARILKLREEAARERVAEAKAKRDKEKEKWWEMAKFRFGVEDDSDSEREGTGGSGSGGTDGEGKEEEERKEGGGGEEGEKEGGGSAESHTKTSSSSSASTSTAATGMVVRVLGSAEGKEVVKDWLGEKYARWERWLENPDDPATMEEREELEALQEKARDEEFEKANPEFCSQFRQDLEDRKKREKERQRDCDEHRERGNDLFRGGKLDEALGEYEAALDLHKLDLKVLLNLSALHARAKRYDEALDFAERAVFLSQYTLGNPTPKSLFRRANAWKLKGNLQEAARDLEQASALDPANVDLKQEAIRARRDTQEAERSKALAHKAATASPPSALRKTSDSVQKLQQEAGGGGEEGERGVSGSGEVQMNERDLVALGVALAMAQRAGGEEKDDCLALVRDSGVLAKLCNAFRIASEDAAPAPSMSRLVQVLGQCAMSGSNAEQISRSGVLSSLSNVLGNNTEDDSFGKDVELQAVQLAAALLCGTRKDIGDGDGSGVEQSIARSVVVKSRASDGLGRFMHGLLNRAIRRLSECVTKPTDSGTASRAEVFGLFVTRILQSFASHLATDHSSVKAALAGAIASVSSPTPSPVALLVRLQSFASVRVLFGVDGVGKDTYALLREAASTVVTCSQLDFARPSFADVLADGKEGGGLSVAHHLLELCRIPAPESRPLHKDLWQFSTVAALSALSNACVDQELVRRALVEANAGDDLVAFLTGQPLSALALERLQSRSSPSAAASTSSLSSSSLPMPKIPTPSPSPASSSTSMSLFPVLPMSSGVGDRAARLLSRLVTVAPPSASDGVARLGRVLWAVSAPLRAPPEAAIESKEPGQTIEQTTRVLLAQNAERLACGAPRLHEEEGDEGGGGGGGGEGEESGDGGEEAEQMGVIGDACVKGLAAACKKEVGACESLLKENGHFALALYLSVHTQSPTHVRHRCVGVGNGAALVIALLDAMPVSAPALLGAGILEPLVQAVKDAGDSPQALALRKNAAVALAKLAKFPPARERLKATNGLQVLLQLQSKLLP